MDVREKLIELLTEFYGCDPMYYNVDALAIADHLIANGVTVRELDGGLSANLFMQKAAQSQNVLPAKRMYNILAIH